MVGLHTGFEEPQSNYAWTENQNLDDATVASYNRSPQLYFACVRNLYDALTIDNP